MRERRRLDSWCAGVGAPAIDAAGNSPSRSAALADIVFVSWNIHVGNGNVRRFVTDLRGGLHTGGRRVDEYVLILQEAVRTSGVPEFADGMSGASHIAAHAPDDSIDIVRIARDLGLSLMYVPSMRNGRSPADPPADRGSALLATMPLDDPVAIELPGEGQRRVAILATAGPVTVGSVHLDALGSWGLRWRLFWTPWLRDAQIRSVERFLPDGPLVVGADLNSWHGRDELAVRALRRMKGATPVSVDRDGLGLRVLDYLFFRVGEDRRAYYRHLQDRYGSDHRPLVGWVE
jgi:hypothetical protein